MCFLLTNSGRSSSSAAFSWSNWRQYLLELIVWFSGRRTPFQSHHIHNITFFGWRWAFGVVCGGSFRLPHNLFPSTLLYSIHFSSPVTICFKNGMFSLLFSRESQAEIQSTRFFSDEHYQAGANDFQHLIWIFWVCQLSPAWYNVDCSQLMSQFDRYQLQLVYLTMEPRPARNLQHKTLQISFDMFDQSQNLLHTLHKSFFFCFSVAFLPFLK